LDEGGGVSDCSGLSSAYGGSYIGTAVLRSDGLLPGTSDTAAPYSARFLGGMASQHYVCGSPNGVVGTPALNCVEILPASTTEMSSLGVGAAWSVEYWYLPTPASMVPNCPFPILNAEVPSVSSRINLAVTRGAGSSTPFYPSMRLVYASGATCTLSSATAAAPAGGGVLSLSSNTFSHVVFTVATADDNAESQLLSAYVNGAGPWTAWCNATGGALLGDGVWWKSVRFGSPAVYNDDNVFSVSYLQGFLAEVALYDVALSAQRISAHYVAGSLQSPPPTPPPPSPSPPPPMLGRARTVECSVALTFAPRSSSTRTTPRFPCSAARNNGVWRHCVRRGMRAMKKPQCG
jgi:hypothetical protein